MKKIKQKVKKIWRKIEEKGAKKMQEITFKKKIIEKHEKRESEEKQKKKS